MTGIVRQKNATYLEWTLHTCPKKFIFLPPCTKKTYSKCFMFQNCKCELEFYIDTSPYARASLYFKRCGELIPELEVLVFASWNNDSEMCCAFPEKRRIRDKCEEIWNHEARKLLGASLTFRIVIHASNSKKDKYVQTGSHLSADESIENLTKDFSEVLDLDQNHDAEIMPKECSSEAQKNILNGRSKAFKNTFRRRSRARKNMLNGRSKTDKNNLGGRSKPRKNILGSRPKAHKSTLGAQSMAHKMILCRRSNTYMAVQNSDMVRDRAGIVEVRDIKMHRIRNFVRFCNSYKKGNIPDSQPNNTEKYRKRRNRRSRHNRNEQKHNQLNQNMLNMWGNFVNPEYMYYPYCD